MEKLELERKSGEIVWYKYQAYFVSDEFPIFKIGEKKEEVIKSVDYVVLEKPWDEEDEDLSHFKREKGEIEYFKWRDKIFLPDSAQEVELKVGATYAVEDTSNGYDIAELFHINTSQSLIGISEGVTNNDEITKVVESPEIEINDKEKGRRVKRLENQLVSK